MDPLQRTQLDRSIRGGLLEHAIKDSGLSNALGKVARSAGLGTAFEQRRIAAAKARAKGRASRAARRRNR